jgi:hypothetical protein
MNFQRAITVYAGLNILVLLILAWRIDRLWRWSGKVGTWLGSFNRRLADLERAPSKWTRK